MPIHTTGGGGGGGDVFVRNTVMADLGVAEGDPSPGAVEGSGAVAIGTVIPGDISNALRPVEGEAGTTGFSRPVVKALGPVTDAELRATPVPVSGPLTDTELRATPVPVSGPLTDTELRATPVPVSGPLTDTELRATPVPVSGAIGPDFIQEQLVFNGNQSIPTAVAAFPQTKLAIAATSDGTITSATITVNVLDVFGNFSATVATLTAVDIGTGLKAVTVGFPFVRVQGSSVIVFGTATEITLSITSAP
jgi:hypothetical protein